MADPLEQKTHHGITLNNVNTRVIIRALAISILFFLALRTAYMARSVLVIVGISFFLALALNPPVSFLAKRLKGARGLATGIAYLVVIGIISILLYFIIPPLVAQTRNFANNIPTYINDIKSSDSKLAKTARKYELPAQLDNIYQASKDNASKAGGPIFNFIKTVVSSFASLITVLLLTFFMLIEGPKWVSVFLQLQPEHRRKHRAKLAAQMYRVVTGFVTGQLFIALLGATNAFLIMTILGMEFALPLAGIVFVLGLIPMIGATLAAVLLVVVGLFKSVTAAIVLGAYFIIYQQLENAFIQPRVQARATNISPLTIMVATLSGGAVGGLLGALAAIPLAACARILVVDYIGRHRLRNRV